MDQGPHGTHAHIATVATQAPQHLSSTINLMALYRLMECSYLAHKANPCGVPLGVGSCEHAATIKFRTSSFPS
eukprot:5677743-Amphidinium_carterae.2